MSIYACKRTSTTSTETATNASTATETATATFQLHFILLPLFLVCVSYSAPFIIIFTLLLLLLLLFLCFLLLFANSANETTNYAFSSPAKAVVEGEGVIVVIVCISQCATDSLTLLFSSLLSCPTLRFVFMFRCNNNYVHTHTHTQERPLSATSAEVMRGMLRYATKRTRLRPRPCPLSRTAQTDRKSVRLSSSFANICTLFASVCVCRTMSQPPQQPPQVSQCGPRR